MRAMEAKMATKEELEALIDTVEILSNPQTMEQIRGSKEAIMAGRIKQVHSVKDLLAELDA
ncbi:MAG: hypothetical protein FLDDKLPJ_00172 [Phycisphaerae bacterium]|nr:hypothetical protein [Phycisphaerae bacterium]